MAKVRLNAINTLFVKNRLKTQKPAQKWQVLKKCIKSVGLSSFTSFYTRLKQNAKGHIFIIKAYALLKGNAFVTAFTIGKSDAMISIVIKVFYNPSKFRNIKTDLSNFNTFIVIAIIK